MSRTGGLGRRLSQTLCQPPVPLGLLLGHALLRVGAKVGLPSVRPTALLSRRVPVFDRTILLLLRASSSVLAISLPDSPATVLDQTRFELLFVVRAGWHFVPHDRCLLALRNDWVHERDCVHSMVVVCQQFYQLGLWAEDHGLSFKAARR